MESGDSLLTRHGLFQPGVPLLFKVVIGQAQLLDGIGQGAGLTQQVHKRYNFIRAIVLVEKGNQCRGFYPA